MFVILSQTWQTKALLRVFCYHPPLLFCLDRIDFALVLVLFCSFVCLYVLYFDLLACLFFLFSLCMSRCRTAWSMPLEIVTNSQVELFVQFNVCDWAVSTPLPCYVCQLSSPSETCITNTLSGVFPFPYYNNNNDVYLTHFPLSQAPFHPPIPSRLISSSAKARLVQVCRF